MGIMRPPLSPRGGRARVGRPAPGRKQRTAGLPCSFRLSNTGNHGYRCTDLTLSSGDTLVFGRQARFACHDEPRIYPGTGHPRSCLAGGRINITMLMTVLGGQ
jgi:hypothetical protein